MTITVHQDLPQRWFPIQEDLACRIWGRQWVLGPASVEWSRAEYAYECYHQLWPQQTLERLADRGGFGWIEYLALRAGTFELRQRSYRSTNADLYRVVDDYLRRNSYR